MQDHTSDLSDLRNIPDDAGQDGWNDGNAGEGPAYLDPQETTQPEGPADDHHRQHPLGVQSRSQLRVHAPYKHQRLRLVNALWNGSTDNHDRRARRLGACGCCPSFRKASAGSVGVDVARCRDRLCPLCGLVRGREVRARTLGAISGWNVVRFLTLTIRATTDNLSERFKHIDDSFTKLRRGDVWKDNVTAAIAVPEVTIGKHGQWHVHLHILCTGHFLPHAQLKKAWHEATGDSWIVHIEAVADRADAAKYVAGYIAGGNEVWRWSESQIREFSDCTHGRRMLRTYGTAKLPSLDDDNEPDTSGPSEHLCNIPTLLRAEAAGSEHIRHAVDVLARLGHTHALLLDRDPPTKVLPDITSAELGYAVEVCELVEQYFPAVPDMAELEKVRRRCFRQADDVPAPKYTQRFLDLLHPQSYR